MKKMNEEKVVANPFLYGQGEIIYCNFFSLRKVEIREPKDEDLTRN